MHSMIGSLEQFIPDFDDKSIFFNMTIHLISFSIPRKSKTQMLDYTNVDVRIMEVVDSGCEWKIAHCTSSK